MHINKYCGKAMYIYLTAVFCVQGDPINMWSVSGYHIWILKTEGFHIYELQQLGVCVI